MNGRALWGRSSSMQRLAFGLVFVGAVALGSACGVDPPEPAADGGGGAVPEGGAVPTPCEEAAGDCAQCVVCANNDPCKALQETCQALPACQGLQECVSLCNGAADVSCVNMCYTMYGAGIDDWEAWATCAYCQVCPNECTGTQQPIDCQ